MRHSLSDFQALKDTKGRLLGFDVGTKTVGISLSDTRWVIASPGMALKRGKLQAMAHLLRQFIGAESIAGIVVGFPGNSLAGGFTPMAKSITDFMVAFQNVFPCPYIFWDERFSTKAAERFLKEVKAPVARREEKIDALAATFILQTFLDFCAHQQAQPLEETPQSDMAALSQKLIS